MSQLKTLSQMHQHAAWAEAALVETVASNAEDIPGALREFAHILGAGETWLARIEQRQPRLAVWPILAAETLPDEFRRLASGYEALMSRLHDNDLTGTVTYVNSAGQEFSNTLGDILIHVALHAQYHRGKVNLLLREGGAAPVPTDFIAYIRGAPAATEATTLDPSKSTSD